MTDKEIAAPFADIVPIGTVIEQDVEDGTETSILRWTVAAVGITGGERYYWLVDEDGAVAMWPGFMVEAQTSERL